MSPAVKGLLVLLIIGAGIGLYALVNRAVVLVPVQNGGGGTETGGLESLSPEAVQQAAADFQQSLGLLENNQYEEANVLLEKLARQLPNEAAVQRNLALNYLIGINALTGDNAPQRLARRRELILLLDAALTKLKTLPGEEVSHALFSARLALAQGREQEAMDLLAVAAAAAPLEAAFPYEISHVAFNSADESLHAAGLRGLEAAHAASPHNLWVLVELMLRQAEAKSPALETTLAAAGTALTVVQPEILSQSNVDVVNLATQARAALKEGDLIKVMQNVRFITNLLRPRDAAQSDKIQLEKHPLEFVAIRLSPAFEQLVQTVNTAGGTAVTAPAAFEFTVSELPAAVGGQALDVALGDFSLNEVPGLCVLRTAGVTLCARQTNSTEWQLLSEASLAAEYQHVLAVDLDADERESPSTVQLDMPGNPRCHKADLDLVLFGASGVLLLKNQLDATTGKRSLEPVSIASELGAIRSVAVVDVDIDGDLDLLLAGENGGVEQWSNQTQWRFGLRQGTPAAVPEGFVVRQFVPVDIDRDVDLDILVVAVDGRCGWLENLRHGLLRFRPLEQAGKPIHGTCLAVTDWNSDATWDVLVGDGANLQIMQGITSPDGKWTIKQSGSRALPAGEFQLADFDNDGQEDLLNTAGRLDLHALHEASTTATELPSTAISRTAQVVIHDLDQNGALDVVAIDGEQVKIWTNSTPKLGNWFELSLVADEYDPSTPAISSQRINQYAIGSTVEMRAGTRYQVRVVNGPQTHFGLGDLTQVDTLRIIWTNGIPQHHVQPPLKALLCEKQVVAGSCPYLYACTPEGTRFVTDLLWAAPLGLPAPEGGMVPDRPWENLKIPGELLAEINGRYRLQLTEELREAAYFDQVQLFAVDHPADVEFHTNEKVGPPAVAEHRLHTAQHLRIPLSAKNQHGRNLLPELSAIDDNYARPYDQLRAHGLTEPTSVELQFDLSTAAAEQPLDLRLFLTGWLHAPDAGVSAAIHESLTAGSTLFEVPQALSVWVPDAAGDWQVAIPFTGFVGGKTKTIVLELGSVLNRTDPRIQLRSSMEFSWDRIGYIVNESQVPLHEIELPLVAANLHARGVSTRRDHQQRGPDIYDYEQVVPYSALGVMGGHFTCYGDVLPLLTAADSLLVVEGPGDELTLEFAALPPPSPGWQRDFVIRNVGWDKDAQMQVVYGQSSEPLPFHGMSGYPYIENPPATSEYQSYLRTYQTRTLSGTDFRRALVP